MSRLILIPLILIVLLVLAAALLIPLLVDKEALMELATKTLHKQTGATLTVDGDTELALFPTLGISLSSAAVTLPGKQEPDLRVRSAKIGVQLLPLITGRVEIDTIHLDGLVVRIESSAQQPAKGSAQLDIAGNAGAALAVPLALNVKRLLVTDARLEEVSATSTTTVLELVKLQATDLNLEQKPIPIELIMRLPGEQPVEMSLKGNIRVDQQTQQIKLDEITTQISGATAQPIKVQTSGSIDLAREVANLRLTGELFGGRLNANATLDSRHDKATFETSGTLDRLDIATALAATESAPVLNGSANLSWQLSSRGHTTKELTAALEGPIKLTTEQVVLQGTSVEKLLCEAVALTNKEQLTASFPADTRVETLNADIRVANGKARLDPLRAELPEVALIGSGSFDLLNENFEVTFKARLSPELEQLDHACRVSKRLTAIDWPVKCTGSVGTEPAKWCRVDSAKILQDLTVNEGRETLKKKASKLLNKLFNKGN
jgi:uncharacterized protein involved in outer membrane biogenesis